jgi:hypothetical protein
MPTVEDVINHLKSYNPKEHIAVAVWSEEDVLERAKERTMKITKEEARDIIDRIDRRQDATIGITWDTIDYYLDELEH